MMTRVSKELSNLFVLAFTTTIPAQHKTDCEIVPVYIESMIVNRTIVDYHKFAIRLKITEFKKYLKKDLNLQAYQPNRSN